MMKKLYTTPRMKVRKNQCSHMLCLSGDVNRGSRYDGSLYDYIGGEGSDGYETSNNPD